MTTSNTAGYYSWNGQNQDRPANRLYAHLLRRESGAGPFLDWGCGTGWLLKRLSRYGYVTGYDPSAEAAEAAAKACGEVQVVSNPDLLPANHFRGISAIHVVEHLTELEMAATLGIWNKKSTKNSILLIATPDAEGEAAQIMGSKWRALADDTHINLRGHTYWREILLGAGYIPIVEGSDGLWETNYPMSRLKSAAHRLACAATVISGKLLIPVGRGESYIGLWKQTPD